MDKPSLTTLVVGGAVLLVGVVALLSGSMGPAPPSKVHCQCKWDGHAQLESAQPVTPPSPPPSTDLYASVCPGSRVLPGHVLSFSVFAAQDGKVMLFGKPRSYHYLHGLLLQLQYAPYMYAGWSVFVYASKDLDAVYLKRLREWGQHNEWERCLNLTVRLMDPQPGTNGAMWRFLAIDEPGVEVALFRDTDSWLTAREVAAVQQWLRSGKALHVFHDHRENFANYLLAGSWGVRRRLLRGTTMQELLKKHGFDGQGIRGRDQTFLDSVVWPLAKKDDDYMSHAIQSKGEQKCTPFPIERVHQYEMAARMMWRDHSHDAVPSAQCRANEAWNMG